MDNFISLHGAYHPNNYGDVLILAIQAKWIEEVNNSNVVLPFATDIYRKVINPSELIGFEGIKRSKKLIYGSGGYLGEPLEKKWKWGFSFFKKHVLPAEYAKLKRIEYAIIGTGVGPITNLFARVEIIRILRNAKLIVVRDNESKDYLVKYGLSGDKIIVTADVALTLKNEDLPIEAVQIAKKNLSSNKLKYGLHAGVDIESKVYGEKVKLLLDETIEFFNKNNDILPVLIIDNDNVQQNNAVNYITQKLKNDYYIYKHNDVWETTAILSELDLVVTNKLHVGIVSYAMNTIPIGIPYHPKTKRFYKQIELEELCIDLLSLRKNKILEILNSTLDPEWKAMFDEKRNSVLPNLYSKAMLNKDYLTNFINDI